MSPSKIADFQLHEAVFRVEATSDPVAARQRGQPPLTLRDLLFGMVEMQAGR